VIQVAGDLQREPAARRRPRWLSVLRGLTLALVAIALAVFSFVFRFNDPGGSFAGLSDDHFFYVVRGWQILFGDLPVRDFVDHGAPLFYYVSAAVQRLGGRGTLSELVFCTAVLSVGAAATSVLAARASGSIVLGAAAGFAQILLEPRFYNYPKILVYVAAIPALWAFANRPTAPRRFLIALFIVVGLLFRHDHGVFVAVAMATLVVLMHGLTWQERFRHLVICGLIVLGLLAPYLVFIEMNGGLGSYLSQAAAWAEHDRQRAGIVWPSLWGIGRGGARGTLVATIQANRVAWLYYAELAIPLLALGVLALIPDALPRGWRNGRAKLASVAVLGVLLNAGFLRSPLEARLADPSVPHLIALAWLAGAGGCLLFRRETLRRLPAARTVAVIVLLLITTVTAAAAGVALGTGLQSRLRGAMLTEGTDVALERMERVATTLGATWPLETWSSRDRPGVLRLSYYLRDCTAPTDRVLVQDYLPQVVALAQRGFAGGHADLRPGFFETEAAQRLTVERLRRQSVPVIALGAGGDYEGFRQSFPIVTAYLDRAYRVVGERALDDRFAVTVLVAKDAVPRRQYTPMDLPCFQ
jgi:hypothetical protein